MVRRADEVVRFVQAKVPAAALDARDADVVYTDDSKFTGKLAAPTLRVLTGAFGEQQLKLADVRGLKVGGGPADDLSGGPGPDHPGRLRQPDRQGRRRSPSPAR